MSKMEWKSRLLAVSLVLALTRGGTAYEELAIDKEELNQLIRSLATGIDSTGSEILDLKAQTSDLLRDIVGFKLGAASHETHCRQLSEWSSGLSSSFAALQDLVLNETRSWARTGNSALGQLVQGLERTETGIKKGLEEFSEVLGTAPRPVALESLPQPSALVSDPPQDCKEAQRRAGMTGVTTIAPSSGMRQRVWCDQDTEGGGWTVVLRRRKQDQQLDFARGRQDYIDGFGDPAGEYWLGLDAQNALTARPSELLVTMAIGAEEAASRYGYYRVGPPRDYRLTVSEFDDERSSGGDSLSYHSGQAFSTKDSDRDGASGGSCSEWSGGGGWWYDYCYFANPTALYGGGRDPTAYSDSYLEWRKWQGYNAYLTDFAMMVRAKQD